LQKFLTAMATQLSAGAIKAMYQNATVQNPVVQVIDIKKILSGNPVPNQPERFRLVISDGVNYQQAMLATQLNNLIKDDSIVVNCVVKLKEFICNTVHNKRIVIVLVVEVVAKLPGPIGNPINIEQSGNVQLGQAQPPPIVQPPPQTMAARVQQQQQVPPRQNNYQPKLANTPQQQYGNNRQTPQQQYGISTNQQQHGDVPSSIYPIKSLNPYQNRWTIKARVTSKSEIRSWNNQKGSGKLFHIDLLDAQGGEIRATMFNDAVEAFYPLLEVGKVYYISKGTLKIANKKFTSIPNEYELSLDRNSQITLCNDAGDIPSMHYNFVPIQSINDIQKDEVVDVLGVAVTIGECTAIVTKQGKELKKRNITLVDRTGVCIDFTLWGDKAENLGFQFGDQPILAIKGAKVSTFNNKTLTSVNSTLMEVNPDIREAAALRSWFDTEGVTMQLNSLSRGREPGQFGDASSSYGPTETKTFEEVKAALTGIRDKPLYFDVKGTITIIRQDGNLWYYACPNCNRKVPQTVDGRCDNCQQSYDKPTPRYILSFCAADHTGSQWLSCFNDVAEGILGGQTAGDMELWREMKDPRFEHTFQQAMHKQYKFRLRGKEEVYQDNWKLKCTVVGAHPVDLVKDSAVLLQQIQQLQL
jgi:replication factor A1